MTHNIQDYEGARRGGVPQPPAPSATWRGQGVLADPEGGFSRRRGVSACVCACQCECVRVRGCSCVCCVCGKQETAILVISEKYKMETKKSQKKNSISKEKKKKRNIAGTPVSLALPRGGATPAWGCRGLPGLTLSGCGVGRRLPRPRSPRWERGPVGVPREAAPRAAPADARHCFSGLGFGLVTNAAGAAVAPPAPAPQPPLHGRAEAQEVREKVPGRWTYTPR